MRCAAAVLDGLAEVTAPGQQLLGSTDSAAAGQPIFAQREDAPSPAVVPAGAAADASTTGRHRRRRHEPGWGHPVVIGGGGRSRALSIPLVGPGSLLNLDTVPSAHATQVTSSHPFFISPLTSNKKKRISFKWICLNVQKEKRASVVGNAVWRTGVYIDRAREESERAKEEGGALGPGPYYYLERGSSRAAVYSRS